MPFEQRIEAQRAAIAAEQARKAAEAEQRRVDEEKAKQDRVKRILVSPEWKIMQETAQNPELLEGLRTYWKTFSRRNRGLEKTQIKYTKRRFRKDESHSVCISKTFEDCVQIIQDPNPTAGVFPFGEIAIKIDLGDEYIGRDFENADIYCPSNFIVKISYFSERTEVQKATMSHSFGRQSGYYGGHPQIIAEPGLNFFIDGQIRPIVGIEAFLNYLVERIISGNKAGV